MSYQESNPGDPLERYRPYLAFLARMHVSPRLAVKADISGIVQQTMIDAHHDLEKWKSLDSNGQLAYLRNLLANNARDEVRKYTSLKRDFRREQSLDRDLETSSSSLMNWALKEMSTSNVPLAREERALKLATALNRLPDSQREALILQYWEGIPLADVAERMQRTPASVAGLLKRGLRQLRDELAGWEESI